MHPAALIYRPARMQMGKLRQREKYSMKGVGVSSRTKQKGSFSWFFLLCSGIRDGCHLISGKINNPLLVLSLAHFLLIFNL